MALKWDDIFENAIAFSKRWKDAHDEKSEAQSFVRDFLAVFGIADAAAVGRFENRAKRDSGRGFMDYFWPKKIAVEMKSKGKNLKNAYDQLKEYVIHLPADEIPDLLMVCDFETIILYRRTTNVRKQFKTKDLHKNVKLFSDIAGYEASRPPQEQLELNTTAAEKMARLYDSLQGSGYEGHDLEVFLVRLLFCMFAEDTGIFPQDIFLNYVRNAKEDGSNLAERINRLFEVLNMPDETRAKRKLLSADLIQFRYINGGLFERALPSADFNAEMRKALIECCIFDWSQISPAIFGAMFQGVMDRTKRRELGVHYTSLENILKLINPLFMDELWTEFERVKTKEKELNEFHEKIAQLKFFDPACGCGNFLMIAYRELRALELEVLKMKLHSRQGVLDVSLLLKVTVEQFYGIEIEPFPCEIAQVGMWLTDHQMNQQAAEHFGRNVIRIPLSGGATIKNENALEIDWESVVPKEELSYILGNPPYVGYSNQTARQKADMVATYLDANDKPLKTAGKIDYVAAWYYKASKYISGTKIRAAFVSTNSVTQGEQVAAVWKPLFEMFDIHIDFAYRTFVWTNEAKGKAAVHCVIIGFSVGATKKRFIYDGEKRRTAKNISPYLVDAPSVFVESRRTPLCDVPEMITGNRPADGGHLIIEDVDLKSFIKADPLAKKYIRRFMGSVEFINDKKRWCLWLVGVPPNELKDMPEVRKRIAACRKDRENSPDAGRRQLAKTPTLFRERISSTVDYIVVPKVSSKRRRYIPIGFVPAATISSDLLFVVPQSTLYHFGILTSGVHMAWTRAVCGRLKSDYRYSKDIVYNNFPWPTATDKQKADIEALSQRVLDARAKYPKSSLADLYDLDRTPEELTKAHDRLDRAVMKLYGFANDMPESQIVAALMERYQELTR